MAAFAWALGEQAGARKERGKDEDKRGTVRVKMESGEGEEEQCQRRKWVRGGVGGGKGDEGEDGGWRPADTSGAAERWRDTCNV